MDSEWLQLTDEDIERAQQLTRARPVTPEAITITSDDINGEERPVAMTDALLTITEEDLAPSAPRPDVEPEIRQLEMRMFELINGVRCSHLPRWIGTAELKWDDGLAAVARGHSTDMLRRQYVAHVSPEGVTAARRIEQHGIRYVACGENIGVFYGQAAKSYQAVEEIHKAFMNQPRSMTNHRGNLLNPIWTNIGIGIAHNPDGSLVVTQTFISAPGRRARES